MLRQYELVDRVLSYDPDADEALLNRAYVFSVNAHGSQKRASGDPYFSHPIEVAGILTDLHLDDETIATAILHDTIEDTVATPEDIQRLFGDNVARMVDGVTKLSKIEAQSDTERAAENLRKGNKVFVEGRFKTREFEGRDGQKRTSLEITADSLVNLEKRNREDGDGEFAGSTTSAPPRPAGAPAGASGGNAPRGGGGTYDDTSDLDDLPF